jgi:hypothetical protein
VAAVAAVVTWWWWPDRGESAAAPRARVYRDAEVCLATDARGVAGPEAAPVWAGMQRFSAASSVRVSYVAVVGGTSEANAATFVAGLVARHCGAVVAVGDPQVAASRRLAARFATTDFLVVDTGAGSPAKPPSQAPDNVHVIVGETDPGAAVAAVLGGLEGL